MAGALARSCCWYAARDAAAGDAALIPEPAGEPEPAAALPVLSWRTEGLAQAGGEATPAALACTERGRAPEYPAGEPIWEALESR